MSGKSPFSNHGLGLLVIHSRDLPRAVEFYTSLGLHFERHAHPPCGEHYATRGEGCVFEICQSREGEQAVAPLTFGFTVSCVDAAVQEAVAKGGALQRAPHDASWGRSATIADPDGNRVLLMERS